MNQEIPVKQDLFIRLIVWIFKKAGRRTLGFWSLLMIVLLSVVLGLAGIVQGLDAGALLPVALAGMLFGWLLARSRCPAWLAAISATTIGLGYIMVAIAQMGRQFVDLLLALNELATGVLRWRPGLDIPDVIPSQVALGELFLRMMVLAVRVKDWLIAQGSGQPVLDPVAVVLVWSLAVWLVAAWASWAIRRLDRPLPALIPAGALLGISLAYVRASAAVLLPFIPVTLLLLAWSSYSARERAWDAQGVDYSEELHFELAFFVILLVLSLSIIAALAPSVSLSKIILFTRSLRQVENSPARPAAGEFLGLKPPPLKPVTNVLTKNTFGGLPRQHLLGSGPELSKQVVMVVRTGDYPPGSPGLPASQSSPVYYWRALTYDMYTGYGWSTGQIRISSYAAGKQTLDEAALERLRKTRRIVEEEVQFAGKSDGLLYVAGDLLRVERDYQAAWRSLPGASNNGNGDLFGAMSDTSEYRAESLVVTASQEQLRAAGSSYPDWVRQRYLFLPDTLPGRVRALALELTATEPTPYDRALAIESYLRTYPYSLDVPQPPRGQDVSDYFLFDLKKGYCDYYATAMVVLARAAGLPARLAMGYASGIYDPVQGRYVVTAADAHSWPEVYFPGYGWVNFEPTAGRPALEHSDQALPNLPEDFQKDIHGGGGLLQLDWQRVVIWVGISGAGLALILLISFLADQWRLRRYSPEKTLELLFQRLYRQGRRLAIPHHPGDTPFEFAASLEGQILALASRKTWESYISSAAPEVGRLADLYAQSAYGPHPPGVSDQRRAIHTWQRLLPRLWLAGFQIRFRRRGNG